MYFNPIWNREGGAFCAPTMKNRSAISMDVFFPAFLELPGSDTLPVPEVNFPGSRPTLEVRESPPSFFQKKSCKAEDHAHCF